MRLCLWLQPKDQTADFAEERGLQSPRGQVRSATLTMLVVFFEISHPGSDLLRRNIIVMCAQNETVRECSKHGRSAGNNASLQKETALKGDSCQF